MPPITVLDDAYATLWWHPESKIVHHKIHRYLMPGVFERLLSTGAEYLERHGAQKWLSDDRNSIVLAPEDVAWGDTEWAPRVHKAGLKYWAIVLSAKAVASEQMMKLHHDRQARGVMTGATTRMFENVEEALAWLESV